MKLTAYLLIILLTALPLFSQMGLGDLTSGKANSASDKEIKMGAVKVLIRLHQKEKYFDTTYKWWGTRPNPHGPSHSDIPNGC